MINYYLLEQNNKNCNLGLSKKVFETISLKALSKIDDDLLDSKDNISKNYCNISILFNKISFTYLLTLKNKDINKEIVKKEIYESLTDEMLTLLDGISFEISYKFLNKRVTK